LKINKLAIFCLSILFFNTSVLAENNFTAGIGMGSLYAGIGLNFGIQSSTDFKYISSGCVSYSSMNGSTCGFGLGYMTTELVDYQSNKHAANFYIGMVGSERDNFDDKALYGAGIGYSYFFSGINKSGGNIGFTVVSAKKSDGLEIGGMLQIGYQF
jgi:hypothetical protein